MRRIAAIASIVPLLLLAACGSDGESSSDATQASTGAAPTVGPGAVSDTDDHDEVADDASTPATVEPVVDVDDGATPAPVGSSGGTATVTLDSGESFDFDGVMCMLESQTVAGSEILFTATAYGDPALDVTQFGSEGVVTDTASIEIYDGDYNTLWASDSMFGMGDTELTLDGSTIRGSGEFLQGDDAVPGDGVHGDVVVNC